MATLSLILVLGLCLLPLCCADLPVSPPATPIHAEIKEIVGERVIADSGDYAFENGITSTSDVDSALPEKDPEREIGIKDFPFVDHPHTAAEPANLIESVSADSGDVVFENSVPSTSAGDSAGKDPETKMYTEAFTCIDHLPATEKLAEVTQHQLTETHCEPVTEIKTALASMIEENTILQDKLSHLTEKLEKLHGVIEYLNTTLTGLEAVNADSTATVAQLQDEYEREVETLQEKVRIAERNATLYENRAHFAKNERTIARLSQENCMLELEAARHTHFDELEALRGEIKALRAAKPVACAPNAVLGGNEKISSKAAHHISEDGSCDARKCLNMFLSKYVFFWAKEHKDASLPRSDSSAQAATAATAQQPSTLAKKSVDPNMHPQSPSSTVGLVGQLLRQSTGAIVTLYKTYVHPALRWFVLWEVRIVAGAGVLLLRGAEVVWSNILSPLLYDSVLPAAQALYSSTLLPWYTKSIRPSADPTVVVVLSNWDAHVVPWYERNLLDYVDYAFGRLHYAAYFTMRFLFDGELESNLERVYLFVAGFVPGVIEQLSSIPALREKLDDNCETVVSVVVYAVVALFLYFIRRFIIGVLAFLLMLVLSPVLLIVYCTAKLVRWFMPRKKSTKKGSGKAPRSGSKSSGMVSPPGQVGALPVEGTGRSGVAGRGSVAGIAERASGAAGPPPSQAARGQRGVQFNEQNDQQQAPSSHWGAYEP